MARMKFICDSERCIECNSCVTACTQEHESPWGVNRRRVVTINDGVADLNADIDYDLRDRLREIVRAAEESITTGGDPSLS